MSVELNLQSTPKRAAVSQLDRRYLALVQQLLASDAFHARGARVLGVTSCLAGEGTSTVAANIALTTAGLDAGPVLLIDANDASPAVGKIFSVDAEVGLQNALSGSKSPLECVTPSPIEHLSLVLNGRRKSGEMPIYSKSSIDELLLEWKDTFAWIIVDLPPASDVSTCTLLASRLDGVLLVVEADRVDQQVAQQTCARLQRANANLLGAVYNKVPTHEVNMLR